jgi:hypothetical protein
VECGALDSCATFTSVFGSAAAGRSNSNGCFARRLGRQIASEIFGT